MSNQLFSLSQLFDHKLLRIPDYQRGYAWQEEQLVEFWEDLANLQPDRYHYTGMVSLKPLKNTDIGWGEDRWLLETNYSPFHVVDGQQRLTTTVILINELLNYIRNLKENAGKPDSQIVLSYETLEEISNKYICKKRPPNRLVATYIFSYEVDNPSAEYMKHRIFGAPNAGTLEETYYTRNLLFAKLFFQKNIEELYKQDGMDGLTSLYKKVTQRMMFVQHNFTDDFDVFIAFETMNNRGKRLTNLELLKNRLIYLTTLFDDSVCDQADKAFLRTQINAAWKEVYAQMGRSEHQLLSDDEFLRAHWIIYFSYSRRTGTDYIDYLLKKFSAKNIFKKKTVGVGKAPDTASDGSKNETNPEDSELSSTLLPTEISEYVNSLKNMAKYWYDSFFPYENPLLSQEEKLWIDRLNRLGIGYFRPLVTVSLCQMQHSTAEERIALYKAIERFIFVSFRIGNFNATFRSSDFHRSARNICFSNESISQVTDELNTIVDEYAEYAFDGFASRIGKFFDQGQGFYSWSTLRYFLYEYEYALAEKNKLDKIDWSMFSRSERDKVSIEHIFPQTPTKPYWRNLYRAYTDEEKTVLSGALGNLLPLSQSVNSALQNDSFPDKKSSKSTGRRGYENGSHSEIEVSKENDWTAEKIYSRTCVLLDFMCKRWNVTIEAEVYEQLLRVSFVNDGRPIPLELTDSDPIHSHSSTLSSGNLEDMQLQFWNGFIEHCKSIGREEDLASRKPGKQNWYDIPVGASDYHLSFTLSRGRYLTLVIYTYGPDTYARFEIKKDDLEKAFGHSFIWGSSRKDSTAKRILYQIEGDIYNPSKQQELYTWMVESFDDLFDALEEIGE